MVAKLGYLIIKVQKFYAYCSKCTRPSRQKRHNLVCYKTYLAQKGYREVIHLLESMARQLEFKVRVVQCHTMLYCKACLVPVFFPTWFCATDRIKLIYYLAKVLDLLFSKA